MLKQLKKLAEAQTYRHRRLHEKAEKDLMQPKGEAEQQNAEEAEIEKKSEAAKPSKNTRRQQQRSHTEARESALLKLKRQVLAGCPQETNEADRAVRTEIAKGRASRGSD